MTSPTFSIEFENESHLNNSIFRHGSEYLTIFHQNIRSWRRHKNDFEKYISRLSNPFDIICLTETYVIPESFEKRLEGYKHCYNHGRFNRNDGVLVFVNERLGCCKFEIVHIADCKAVEVVISPSDGSGTYTITALYRSPRTNKKKFVVGLNAYLKRNRDLSNHIILGDMNIDIKKQNAVTKSYLGVMLTHKYISAVNEYTRVTPSSKTCIDHILMKLQNAAGCTSGVIDTGITKHDHKGTILAVRL